MWSRRSIVAVLLAAAALLVATSRARSQDTTVTRATTGTLTGRVVDDLSQRPVPLAVLDVVGTALATQTDADGRYRLTLATGVYRFRLRRLGYKPVHLDSVRVVAGETTTRDFALASAAANLESVEITGTAGSASDAAMIDQQRNAAAVIDGISAQAISRAPGSNAAEAIARVTGIAIMDKKFTIVRGLPERYSNTLLNSVELPSPEPLRKIVPLDIFPASLLESIVATKTATPDRPGDFAGGSVEIRTKEFPEERVVQVSLSQDWNSATTFREASYVPRHGVSWLGFASGDRAMPAPPAVGNTSSETMERFAESLRNVWTPRPRPAPPGVGLGLSVGDRLGARRSLGYTASLAYASKIEVVPGRLYQFVSNDSAPIADRGFVAHENISVVDWGAIANLAFLPRPTQKLGWKNLYTRNAEEIISSQDAFDTYRGDERARVYQVRYVARELIQTQLTGDHTLPFLRSRFEWKATAARARRDEPDNRSAKYIEDLNTGVFALQFSQQGLLWFRFLEDDVRSAHGDWTLPVDIWGGRQLSIKSGGMTRRKTRDFSAQLFTFKPATTPPSGQDVLSLPPERAFAPEHVGGPEADISLYRLDAGALPYHSRDDLHAGYAMIDFPLLGWLRLVGGARVEQWRLDVQPKSGVAVLDSVTKRRELDVLPSLNITVGLTSTMNLRLAAYQTLTRPDPRELSNDYYTPVTGECGNQGNDELRHTRIRNADVRWEMYPAQDELLAISAFYKEFTEPVIEVVSVPTSATCVVNYLNAESALNYGGEMEVRTSLGFLPLVPRELFAGVNVTLVKTRADLGEQFDGQTTPFMGQSPYVVNASLIYTSPGRRFTASALAHAYGERITRYGATLRDTSSIIQIPHVREMRRVVVDAKAQTNLSKRLALSASAKNLFDAPQLLVQSTRLAPIRTGYVRSGVSVKIGVGYDW